MSYPHFPAECAGHHGLVRDFGGERPRIVVLCGSTRFVDEFNRQRKALTEAGEIVLSIEVVTTQARDEDPQHCDPALKDRLDELHKRKIDLADYAFVLNVGQYTGESTRDEISYAREHGKPIRFLEPCGCLDHLGMDAEAASGPDGLCDGCRASGCENLTSAAVGAS